MAEYEQNNPLANNEHLSSPAPDIRVHQAAAPDCGVGCFNTSDKGQEANKLPPSIVGGGGFTFWMLLWMVFNTMMGVAALVCFSAFNTAHFECLHTGYSYCYFLKF